MGSRQLRFVYLQLLHCILLGQCTSFSSAQAQHFEWREASPPSAVIGPALLYDDARGRVLMLGGKRSPLGAGTRDLWSISPGGEWTRLPSAPENMFNTHVVRDTRRDRLIYYGSSQELCCFYYGGMSALSLADGSSWTPVQAGNVNWIGGIAVYDSLRDRIVNWRSDAWFAGTSAEVKTKSLASSSPWTVAASSGTPPPTSISAAGLLDKANDRLLVLSLDDGDLWQLGLATLAWTPLGRGGSTAPTALLGAGFHTGEQSIYTVDRLGVAWVRELANGAGWTRLPSTLEPPPPSLARVFAWDEVGKRLFLKPETPSTLVCLRFSPQPAWETLSAERPMAPSGIKNAISLDPNTGRAILGLGVTTAYGPECRSQATTRFLLEASVRGFDLRSSQADWTTIADLAFTPHGSLVVDPARSRALLFGGGFLIPTCSEQGGAYYFLSNDGRAVDLKGLSAAIEFDTLGAPPPPGRFQHGAVWDMRRDRMLVAGGWQGYESGLSDLWQLDGSSLRWSRVTTQGISPTGATRLFADNRRDRIIAVPRWDPSLGVNNRYIYFLDPATSTWTRLDAGRVLPANSAMAIDSNADRLLVFGGRPDGQPGDSFWEIPLADPTLARVLTMRGEPPFTDGAEMVMDPISNRLLMQAGTEPNTSPGGEMHTAWTVSFGFPTPISLQIVGLRVNGQAIELTAVGAEVGSPVRIERQVGDAPWEQVATVESDHEGSIDWQDQHVAPGHVHLYRIHALDRLGRPVTAERSLMFPLTRTERLSLAPIRPNPVDGALTLAWQTAGPTPVTFTVRDLQGRTIETWNAPAGAISSTDVHRLRAGIRPGLYLLTARAGPFSQTRSFVIMR